MQSQKSLESTNFIHSEDHKEGYGETKNEFYPDDTISCEEGKFGEYYVPDVGVLNRAKMQAASLFKNHKGWSAKKVARKVAEKLKLKKLIGQVPVNFFGILNDPKTFDKVEDPAITVEDIKELKGQLDEAGIQENEYKNHLSDKPFIN